MEELGFTRRDARGKETWRNKINERIIFDEELQSVLFKDETGDSFLVTRDILESVARYMASKGW